MDSTMTIAEAVARQFGTPMTHLLKPLFLRGEETKHRGLQRERFYGEQLKIQKSFLLSGYGMTKIEEITRAELPAK